ncbi:MAG: peptidoglycan-binding protein LysM [Bacteroidota bacterium]|nr:peptidoglycan-binding protein LysM [Bacteroidota bacterium]
MKKKWYLLLFCTVGGSGLVASFDTNKETDYIWTYTQEEDTSNAFIVPTQNQLEFNHFEIPFSGKSFVAFRQALAFRESQGRYDLVNKFGYAGKYQFGKTSMQAVGVYNRTEFLRNPILQEEAFIALLSINKHLLKDEIEKYSGMVFNGIEVTESGILASAHLLGAYSVKKYLRSKGRISKKDAFGTNIRSYMKKFGGYDTSIIVANPNAKATDNLVRLEKRKNS